MPVPQIRPQRTVAGETREWDGSNWVPLNGAAAPPSAPMISLPPGAPSSGRTDAQDLELLKQFLTTGGTVAGGLAGGLPGAIVGGAAGRMFGHAPEAMVTSSTGRPNDSSFAGDAALGGMEGAVQELLPAVAGPVLKYAVAKPAQILGRALFDDPAAAAWTRARTGAVRSWIAPEGFKTAAAVGPIVASEVGRGAENVANRIGTGTLSERLTDAIDSLYSRLTAAPELTHADRLAAGAEDYAGARRAARLQEAAAAKGSGVTPGELGSVRVRTRTPEQAIGFEPAPAGAGDFFTNAELIADDQRLAREMYDKGFSEDAAHQIVFGRPSEAPFPRTYALSDAARDQSWKKLEPLSTGTRGPGAFLEDLRSGEPGIVPNEGVTPAPPVIDPAAQAIRDQTAAGSVGALARNAVPANVSAARGAANMADTFAADASATPGITVGARPARFQSFDMPAAAPPAAARDDLAAELARRFGSPSDAQMTVDLATRPNPIDVGLSNDTLDALAKRLGLVKDKPF